MARLSRDAAPKFCERYQMRWPSSRYAASPVRIPTSTARSEGTQQRLRTWLAKMALLSDLVCLTYPRTKRVVNVGRLRETKVVHVVPCGDRLDLAEARMLEAAGENDVAVEPLTSRRDLRKGHADLEGNAGLLR